MTGLDATVLAPGLGAGPVLAIPPLSFWGGIDPATGTVIDRSHPAHGRSVTGMVLVMPSGRGSSSSSAVFAEAIRLGTAPTAILLAEPDPILAVGALVAQRLYAWAPPVVVLGPADYARAAAAKTATIEASERLTVLVLG